MAENTGQDPTGIDAIFSDIVHRVPELFDYDARPREVPSELFEHPPRGHIAFNGGYEQGKELPSCKDNGEQDQVIEE